MPMLHKFAFWQTSVNNIADTLLAGFPYFWATPTGTHSHNRSVDIKYILWSLVSSDLRGNSCYTQVFSLCCTMSRRVTSVTNIATWPLKPVQPRSSIHCHLVIIGNPSA